VAAALRRRGHAVVESFLELAEPDIDGGAGRCVEQGAGRVVLVPYFLSAGVHVRRDLAAARDRLARRYPHVEFRLAEPLGRHPLLPEVVAQRAEEACRADADPD
jgi:sirohydrochlorin ferrochelatase